MIRLSSPTYTFEQVIDICALGITGNQDLKLSVEATKELLVSKWNEYLTGSSNGELYTMIPVDVRNNLNPAVLNGITKHQFIKLYETYFVPEEKPAREIYDKLLNAAKDSCPFCGGIGTPRNLDHFLPKSHFPEFSILPNNLVPCCRDCNMEGKGSQYATQAEHQIIQPYLDNERFFVDQWIFARYELSDDQDPGEFHYFVSAPEAWPYVDRLRAEKHFQEFNLARRYAVRSAQALGTILSQVTSLQQRGLTNAEICDSFLAFGVSESQFPNHWQRGFYQALILYFSKI